MTAEFEKIDHGFLPIMGEAPKILILGTLPSVKSFEQNQYYGNPQNAFWWIMSSLLGFDLAQSYSERCTELTDKHIAVWDVIASCHRPGSLDSKIDQSTLKPNDFVSLLNQNSSIQLLVFNGQAANKLFNKFVELESWGGDFLTLPSTSPANAAMNKATKLSKWRQILAYL